MQPQSADSDGRIANGTEPLPPSPAGDRKSALILFDDPKDLAYEIISGFQWAIFSLGGRGTGERIENRVAVSGAAFCWDRIQAADDAMDRFHANFAGIHFVYRGPSMHRKARRSGFTLVEVLIVVVILAILAAAVVPQFSSSTQDAKVSTSVFNLQTLRAQVQVYKAQHNGVYPPTLAKLTEATSKAGGAPSGNDSYGPYILEVPECPIVANNTEVAATSATPAVVAGGAGWAYHSATGTIWINHADYLTD